MLALLDERDSGVQSHLDSGGVDSLELHAEVRRALRAGEERLWEGILVTPRVRKIIGLAEASVGDRDVEPSDLLVALRAEGGSLAAEMLRRATRNTTTSPE